MKRMYLENLLVPSEVALDNRPNRRLLVPSRVFGMLIFIVTEVMFFASLIRAYLIIRAGFDEWPPWGQPRLPIEMTAFNTLLLLASAGTIHSSRKLLMLGNISKAYRLHICTILLGSGFLLLQGFEWIQMLQFGLTLTSSVYGSIFYLIIGTHGIHVLGALLVMGYVSKYFNTKMWSEKYVEKILPIHILWYFVVGIWPLLYILVYLL